MTPQPTHLERVDDSQLLIRWSDNVETKIPYRLLRDQCPCATCREKRGAPKSESLLPVLAPEELQPLNIVGMKPVGGYAYGIQFSDGHDSGIFTFEFLRSLAGESDDASAAGC